MRYLILAAAVTAAMFEISCSRAQEAPAVDQQPLEMKTTPAFPELQWPDWVTGADEGLAKEPRPIILTGAGDGTNRMFLATQPGTIHVFPNDPAVEEMVTFLDLREKIHYRVPQENEEGFLGLAFHPKYRENGEFFVYYTAAYTDEKERRSVISRFRADPNDPNKADPSSEQILLEIPDKFWNHNGGTLAFGPDGYLYIGLGDGGMGGDPDKNGQNLGALWGKILRIDVDHKDPGLEYAVPKDNPFVGQEGARGEVWCYGIRNVWRIAFDRETGELWAGDVGQDKYEEIDIIRKGGNYGWNLREGFHQFSPAGANPPAGVIDPIWEYDRQDGKSITGGNVYRGRRIPELVGAYLYADFVSGKIWALWYDSASERVTANRLIVEGGGAVMSFGEDDLGETYYMTQDGGLFRFVAPAQSASN
jgi:glucose/arabinose dehydrogenase